MGDGREPSEETLKQAILELREPVVFRHLLHNPEGANIWKFLDWDMSELAKKMEDLPLPFRTGRNARTLEPQWDTKCAIKNMTMEEFLKESKSQDGAEEWYYFDYKYMHEWLKDQPEILASFDWRRFGFEKWGADSTLWIGSKGAHTNCHQDSYGCNLVAQMHGRKQWLLFPPDSGDMLRPTRVPYEESTIYSRLNFFCPTKEDEESILKVKEKARMVVLEPGEVLLVPGGWWHYVESLDLTVSVNIWLPLSTDCRSRVREALVKLVVNRMAKGIPSATDEPPPSLHHGIKLVGACIEECKKEGDVSEPPSAKRARKVAWTAQNLVKEYSDHILLLREMESTELKELLTGKRDRFPDINGELLKRKDFESANAESCDSSFHQTMEDIVNALCHPDVIDKATQILLDTVNT